MLDIDRGPLKFIAFLWFLDYWAILLLQLWPAYEIVFFSPQALSQVLHIVLSQDLYCSSLCIFITIVSYKKLNFPKLSEFFGICNWSFVNESFSPIHTIKEPVYLNGYFAREMKFLIQIIHAQT